VENPINEFPFIERDSFVDAREEQPDQGNNRFERDTNKKKRLENTRMVSPAGLRFANARGKRSRSEAATETSIPLVNLVDIQNANNEEDEEDEEEEDRTKLRTKVLRQEILGAAEWNNFLEVDDRKRKVAGQSEDDRAKALVEIRRLQGLDYEYDDQAKMIANVVIGIGCLLVVLYLMYIIVRSVTGGSKKSQDTVKKCLKANNVCEGKAQDEVGKKKKELIDKSSAWFKTYGEIVTDPVKVVLVVLLLVMVIFIMKGRRNKTSRRRRTEYIALFVVASVTSIEGLALIAIPPFVDYRFKNELATDLANCSNKLELCKDEINHVQEQIDKENQRNFVKSLLNIVLVIVIMLAVYRYGNSGIQAFLSKIH
jgi:hypothetical protein